MDDFFGGAERYSPILQSLYEKMDVALKEDLVSMAYRMIPNNAGAHTKGVTIEEVVESTTQGTTASNLEQAQSAGAADLIMPLQSPRAYSHGTIEA